MSSFSAIELAIGDLRTIINGERQHSEAVLTNHISQIDALIENHRVSIKLLEEFKDQLATDHAAQNNQLAAVVGDNHA